MKQARRIKHTFRLPPELSRKLADHAARKRVAQALVVETALGAFLTPDTERSEAVLVRRLDHHARQLGKLDYHVELTTEALALFVRFWLTVNPPLPDSGSAAARAQGNERYEQFVEALARRMEGGRRLGEIVAGKTL